MYSGSSFSPIEWSGLLDSDTEHWPSFVPLLPNAPRVQTQSVVVPTQPSARTKSVTLPAQVEHLLPSFKWSRSSCWLDAGLETIWTLVKYNFEEFAACFEHISTSDISGIYQLFQMLDRRRTLALDGGATYSVQTLTEQRDSFRAMLADCTLHQSIRIIRSVESSENPMVNLSIYIS